MGDVTPDTLFMSVEHYDAMLEALGYKDEVTYVPTNRKARRAHASEMRKRKAEK